MVLAFPIAGSRDAPTAGPDDRRRDKLREISMSRKPRLDYYGMLGLRASLFVQCSGGQGWQKYLIIQLSQVLHF